MTGRRAGSAAIKVDDDLHDETSGPTTSRRSVRYITCCQRQRRWQRATIGTNVAPQATKQLLVKEES
jgi:hypothetical protein